MVLKKTAANIILNADEKKRLVDFFLLLMEIDKKVNGHKPKRKKRKATKLSDSIDGSQPMRAFSMGILCKFLITKELKHHTMPKLFCLN